MIENEGQLLDALDEIPYAPFEMAVCDALGRVGVVYADEDGLLGILRVPYEDELCEIAAVTAEDFPMRRLVSEPTEPEEESGQRSGECERDEHAVCDGTTPGWPCECSCHQSTDQGGE